MMMTGTLFHYEKAAKLVDPKRQTLLPIEKALSLLDLQAHDILITVSIISWQVFRIQYVR